MLLAVWKSEMQKHCTTNTQKIKCMSQILVSQGICGLNVNSYLLDPVNTHILLASMNAKSNITVSAAKLGCGQKHLTQSQQTWINLRSPWVPLHLLLVSEAQEAGADAHGHPGADSVEQPLEGEEAGHRDGEDKLAEWVHGHPTPLWKDKERNQDLKN